MQRPPHVERAREQLPTVILTLLSIVQALALELLWSRIQADPALFTSGDALVLGWLQVATVFTGIVLIWLVYVSAVIRFTWLPRTDDLVMPFLVGVVEFTLIDTMGVDHLGPWFLAHAMLFATMTWVAQTLMRRARLDGGNTDYFRHFTPATWRDFRAPSIVVLLLIATGGWFWHQGGSATAGAVASGALLVVFLSRVVAMDIFFRRGFQPPADES